MTGGLVRILSEGLAARRLPKGMRVALSVGELASLGLALFLMTRLGLAKAVAGHSLGSAMTLLVAGGTVVLSIAMVWVVRKASSAWSVRARSVGKPEAVAGGASEPPAMAA